MFDFNAWAEEFLSQPTQPMSNETSHLFLAMVLGEKGDGDLPSQITEQFLYQVIEARAKHIGLDITPQAAVFLMFLTKNPGSAVMYLYAMRSRGTTLNMDTIANNFPMGFLTEETLSKMWDKQKGYVNDVKVDNCLDSYSFAS